VEEGFQGQQYVAFSNNSVIKTRPGRAYKIFIVTISGAGAQFELRNDTGSFAGTPLFMSPASPAVGDIYLVDMPYTTGISLHFAGAQGASGVVTIS